MEFEITQIIKKYQLEEAIKFIHTNNFSINTTAPKIATEFGQKILGLSIKHNGQIIGNIFYYYQPDFKYNNKIYKVVNFATIYILAPYRGKGVASLMIEKTLKIFKNYIITDYTPVGGIFYVLKKFDFGFMQNTRRIVLPIPNLNFNSLKFKFGKLQKINNPMMIKEVFGKLEQYRLYEIDLWTYTFGRDRLMLGLIDRTHYRKFSFFKLKSTSKRVLWASDEKLLLKYSSNIAFKFCILEKKHFITTDTEQDYGPLFSIKIKNQFMIFPKIKIKIPTLGSEFFSNNL